MFPDCNIFDLFICEVFLDCGFFDLFLWSGPDCIVFDPFRFYICPLEHWPDEG